MDQAKDVKISIAPHTILSIVATLLILWILYQVRDIALLFLVVLALVVALSPIIRAWEKYLPRPIAILILYILLFFALVLISALILPPVVSQLSDFLSYLQHNFANSGYTSISAIQRFQDNVNLLLQGQGFQALGQLVTQFRGSLGAVYNTTLGFLGGIIGLITVFVSSFYLLQDENNIYQMLTSFFPERHHKKIHRIIDGISNKMGSWLRGQLLLMVIVGLADGLALGLLGVPYALLLGLWAGLTEVLPYAGPIIGALPGVILAFASLGLVKGVVAILIYLAVQQIESQFLVPKIMGRALGLSPVTIIFSLLIGGKLLGFIGVVIAIPVAAALSVIYREWRTND